MPSLVLMKAFENAPARYDGAMRLVTLGRIDRMKRAIAARVPAGARVLDVGCGTASLALLLARRGAHVVGIDTSETMLDVARRRVAVSGLAGHIELERLSALELHRLPRASFDAVVSTLVLSELTVEERVCMLTDAQALLRRGGQLLVADEVVPPGRVRRATLGALRLPLRLAAYLVGQAQALSPRRRALTLLYFAIELPLMLLVFFCVPPASEPLEDASGLIEAAGFRVMGTQPYLAGTLTLVHAGVPA